jgi:hypothetical protein
MKLSASSTGRGECNKIIKDCMFVREKESSNFLIKSNKNKAVKESNTNLLITMKTSLFLKKEMLLMLIISLTTMVLAKAQQEEEPNSHLTHNNKRALRPGEPGLPGEPARPPPSGTCPSGGDIWFIFEGVVGGPCETISFYLDDASQYPNIDYSHSLAGLGNDIPGNTDIGLDSVALIHQPDAPNYIFVAKVAVPGCPEVLGRCLLDCAPGGNGPGQLDPPFCGYV